jgi:hypothetical protein
MIQPLSFDRLQAILHQHTADLPDFRKPSPNTRYTIQGAALGALGIFFTQSPSFLECQRRLRQHHGRDNAQTLFGVEPIPSDNQVRKLLDSSPTVPLSACRIRFNSPTIPSPNPILPCYGSVKISMRMLFPCQTTSYSWWRLRRHL